MSKKIVYIIFFIFITSCINKKDSIGDFNEICIVSSNEDKNFLVEKINKLFNAYINTPIKENIYKIKWLEPEEFLKNKIHRNLMIISLSEPIDSTIDIFNVKLSKNVNENSIFVTYNMYSRNQIITFINANDSLEFVNIINDNKKWILKNINDHIEKSIYDEYLNNDNNIEIINLIKEKFKFELFIDENYKLIKKNENLIWIGRGYPYRWIIIFKTKNNTNKWYLFKDYIENNINDVKIVEHFKVLYDNKINGLYEQNTSDTGGPFITYMFENNNNNEVTFISGFVNNPGKDKYFLLKQLEVIIKNLQDMEKYEL